MNNSTQNPIEWSQRAYSSPVYRERQVAAESSLKREEIRAIIAERNAERISGEGQQRSLQDLLKFREAASSTKGLREDSVLVNLQERNPDLAKMFKDKMQLSMLQRESKQQQQQQPSPSVFDRFQTFTAEQSWEKAFDEEDDCEDIQALQVEKKKLEAEHLEFKGNVKFALQQVMKKLELLSDRSEGGGKVDKSAVRDAAQGIGDMVAKTLALFDDVGDLQVGPPAAQDAGQSPAALSGGPVQPDAAPTSGNV